MATALRPIIRLATQFARRGFRAEPGLADGARKRIRLRDGDRAVFAHRI
ncbi:MAG: hypothetical protein H0V64_09290 [Geodermatophilaceae bacterium]|jgi:hypothetical protein|nr:hypothetical protein [Geodermatophilaceae bacterium]